MVILIIQVKDFSSDLVNSERDPPVTGDGEATVTFSCKLSFPPNLCGVLRKHDFDALFSFPYVVAPEPDLPDFTGSPEVSAPTGNF